jgi:hypothetical protein
MDDSTLGIIPETHTMEDDNLKGEWEGATLKRDHASCKRKRQL